MFDPGTRKSRKRKCAGYLRRAKDFRWQTEERFDERKLDAYTIAY